MTILIALIVLIITLAMPHIVAYIILDEVFGKEVGSSSFIQFLKLVYFI